jgi:hypothetical protein
MTEPTQFDEQDRRAIEDIGGRLELVVDALREPLSLAQMIVEQRCHHGFRMVGNCAPLFAALAKARGEFPVIPKNCSAKVFGTTASGKPFEYTFEYADLGSIVRATAPALSAHGLALFYPLVNEGSQFTALVMLTHESGCFLESKTTFGAVEGKYGPDDQKTAGRGTYWTRYGVRGVLGIAAEDDDDGNAANDNHATITRKDQGKPAAASPAATKTKAQAQAEGRERAGKAVAEATGQATPKSEPPPSEPVDEANPPASKEAEQALWKLAKEAGITGPELVSLGKAENPEFPDAMRRTGGLALVQAIEAKLRVILEDKNGG